MQIKHNFITPNERQEIIEYIRSYQVDENVEIGNERVRYLTTQLKGYSTTYDFTKTELSQKIANLQSDNRRLEEVPPLLHNLMDRASDLFNVKDDHVFVQGLFMGNGGRASPHYDAGIPGYITYKCNVVVKGPENDVIHVDKQKFVLNELDIYAFESNLYKHWMDAGEERIVLSYGFIVPYADLGVDPNSPRIRLSDKIWRKNNG